MNNLISKGKGMKIGAYDIYPTETGTFYLDGGSMFGIIPRVLWEKTNPPDDRNRIILAARCLLIIGNDKKILMDNGNGTKISQKFRDLYGYDDSIHNINKSLEKYSVTSEEITDVVISHLHFDHAGGSTVKANGIIKPAFPNATYHVQKIQWENALNPNERDRASYNPDDYRCLKDYGVLNLVVGVTELFPQITVLVSNGHSPGLQLLKISDGRKTLFFAADLMPCTSHVPLPYIMGFDLRPLDTLEDKKKYLNQAVEEEWIIFFEHDPVTIAGKVKRTEKGYAFDSAIDFV